MARKDDEPKDLTDKKDEMTDIEDETKVIFECYVANSLEQDKNNNIIDPGTPGVKIERLPSIDSEKCRSIGKKLVELSEKINFDDNDSMLRQILNLINLDKGSEGAFQDFTSVAERVLSNRLSLEPILYLFRFGYLIARDRLIQGARDFMQQLYQWIRDVFNRFSVFDWIRDQGGWSALISQSVSNRPILLIGGAVAIVAILGILYMRYRRS